MSRPHLLRSWQGVVGSLLLSIVVAIAVFGPMFAPYPLDKPIGIPGERPGPNTDLLGTDYLGRDVLSRVLHGGFPVLWVSLVSAVLIYLLGVAVGLVAGMSRSWVDAILMRSIDLLIVFPPLVLLLLLIAGAGNGTWTLILGVVLVLFPGVARIVRAATLEVSTKSYIEAAMVRGERFGALLTREILPNIIPSVVADAGVRFLGAVFIIASLDFLGFGAQPPAANWALMIAENRPIITTNFWSVLAPAVLLAMLTIAVNLIGDAYIKSRSRSRTDT